MKNLDLPAIWYAQSGRFQFGHLTESVRTIGARLAFALATGKDEVLFRGEKRSSGGTTNYPVLLSIQYVQEMLKFVAQHGWFWDEVDDYQNFITVGERHFKCDHAFDRQHITPGVYFAEVKALCASADELLKRAAEHRKHASGTPIAEQLEAAARRLRATASQLLKKDLPSY